MGRDDHSALPRHGQSSLQAWCAQGMVERKFLDTSARHTLNSCAYIQWAHGILASCPSSLENHLEFTLVTLRSAIEQTETAYQAANLRSMPPLLPRPALLLFSYVTCALYMIEHTVWAYGTGQAEADTDAEIFRRWVEEGGFTGAVDEVVRVSREGLKNQRTATDTAIVYGGSAQTSTLR